MTGRSNSNNPTRVRAPFGLLFFLLLYCGNSASSEQAEGYMRFHQVAYGEDLTAVLVNLNEFQKMEAGANTKIYLGIRYSNMKTAQAACSEFNRKGSHLLISGNDERGACSFFEPGPPTLEKLQRLEEKVRQVQARYPGEINHWTLSAYRGTPPVMRIEQIE